MQGSWIALFVALWAVVLFLLVCVLGLSRRMKILETRLGDGPLTQGPLDGAPAVGEFLPLPRGHEDLHWGPRSGMAHVVLFLNSTCGSCVTLGERLEAQAEDRDGLPEALRNTEILIVTDSAGEPIFGHLGIGARLVTQANREISRELGIRVSPFGLGIDTEGIVRAVALPNTVQDVVGLAEACGLTDPVQAGT